MQVCLADKHSEEVLDPAVGEQLMRHALRLVALAPDNPASHEIMCYAVLRCQAKDGSVGVIREAAK